MKISMDPVFGDIQDAPTFVAVKEGNRIKPMPCPKLRGSNFATTVTTVNRKENKGNGYEKSCLNCKGCGHTLESCILLEKKAHSEKMNFLKTNGVCFGCLCIGHISKECRKRLSCKICCSRLPSMLHIHQQGNEAKAEKERNTSEKAVDTGMVEI